MYRVGEADNDVSGGGSSLLSLVRNNRAGLATLRDDHLEILDNIRRQPGTEAEPGAGDRDIEERITAVTESLQLLEVGVAESGVMLSLAAHFDTMESERTLSKMEMRRVKVGCWKWNNMQIWCYVFLQGENDWLREELEDTEKRLEDALSRLAQFEEEKKHWDFMEETRKNEKEATLKPVTPSKIPVGSFRVEEEKAINRALNGSGQTDSNRAASPPPPSRIPKFFKPSSNYMKVKVRFLFISK